MTTLHVAYRYGDTRLFARLVCLLSGGDSAHVEMAEPLGGGLWRCVSSSWMDGGPRVKDMPLPAEKWRVYKADRNPQVARDWLTANQGQGLAKASAPQVTVNPVMKSDWTSPRVDAPVDALGRPTGQMTITKVK